MARSFDLGGVRWWPAAGADVEAVRLAARRALEALETGRARNEKSGRRKELYSLALLRPGEPDHLLKVNQYPALGGLRRRIFGAKSRRELALAETLARRGIATPVPLAAGERRRRGRVVTCYLLVPILRGARDLRRVAADPGLDPRERRALASAFGAFARRVHDAGVWQGDFQPNNFLLGPRGPGDLLLIDYERVRLRRALPARARAAMLAKLERELAGARLAERARFLRAYAGGDRVEARARFGAVGAAVRALAARDAARFTRGTARRGRRYTPLAVAGWRGARAADAGAAALAPEFDALLAAAPCAAAQGFTLHAGAACFALRFPSGRRSGARRGFALALLLFRRRLSPRPVAFLERGREGAVVFEGPLPDRLDHADAAARRAELPALTGLLARLAALGTLEAPDPALVGRGSAPALLAPPLLAPGGRGGLTDRGAARALAKRLLGLPPA